MQDRFVDMASRVIAREGVALVEAKRLLYESRAWATALRESDELLIAELDEIGESESGPKP